MTNELAIRILTGDVLGTASQTSEAIKTAVKALSMSSAQTDDFRDVTKKIDHVADVSKMGDMISRQMATSLPVKPKEDRYFQTQNLDDAYEYGWYDLQSYIEKMPSAQPEPDWDYSEETKQITLIVPEDVYNSTETIFLSVGHEGKFGIRGMVYSAQPERPKGHWIFVHPLQENDPGAYMCSECRTGDWDIDPVKDKFCKFCGADMRGKQND